MLFRISLTASRCAPSSTNTLCPWTSGHPTASGVFTPDGELAIIEPGDTEAAVTYRGHDELRTVIELVSGYSTTFHVMANHTCRVDGTHAEGDVYCYANHLTEDGQNPASNLLMLIRYHDVYAKADGAWRIVKRDVLRLWNETHSADRARLFG
jgi:hypothetical protein